MDWTALELGQLRELWLVFSLDDDERMREWAVEEIERLLAGHRGGSLVRSVSDGSAEHGLSGPGSDAPERD